MSNTKLLTCLRAELCAVGKPEIGLGMFDSVTGPLTGYGRQVNERIESKASQRAGLGL